MGIVILVAGSLSLLSLVCWATFQSAQILKKVRPSYNILLAPAENGFRLLLVGFCLAIGWGSGVAPARLDVASPAPLKDLP